MAYANRVVPEARGEAAAILQKAEGYREQTVAEARGLLTADMVLWNLEALFKLGRYDKLREAIAEHSHLFQAGGKHPPQVPDVLRLWGASPIRKAAA